MTSLRLGISSYTYVWAVGVPGYPLPPRPMTAEDLLEKAVELGGVRVVQIADNLPLDRRTGTELDALAERARRWNLQLEAGTCGTDPAHLRTYLRIARRIGSNVLRVVPDTATSHPGPGAVVAALRDVLPDFARAGVRLAVENHDRFPAAVLAAMLERLDSPYVGICLDTANSLGCAEGLDTLVRTLGGRVVNLHVKDVRITRLPHRKGFLIEGCPAGEGQIDIPHLLAELGRVRGTDELSVILEQWPPYGDSIGEAVAREDAWAAQSIQYLRPLLTAGAEAGRQLTGVI